MRTSYVLDFDSFFFCNATATTVIYTFWHTPSLLVTRPILHLMGDGRGSLRGCDLRRRSRVDVRTGRDFLGNVGCSRESSFPRCPVRGCTSLECMVGASGRAAPLAPGNARLSVEGHYYSRFERLRRGQELGVCKQHRSDARGAKGDTPKNTMPPQWRRLQRLRQVQ